MREGRENKYGGEMRKKEKESNKTKKRKERGRQCEKKGASRRELS